MKKSTAISIAIALFVIVASANSALAEDKIITGPASPTSNQIAPSTGNKVEHLSNTECTTLGGKVATSTVCNSKVACSTTDQNGAIHTVCIAEEKK